MLDVNSSNVTCYMLMQAANIYPGDLLDKISLVCLKFLSWTPCFCLKSCILGLLFIESKAVLT